MLRVVFYRTPGGKEPVVEWLRELPKADRVVVEEDLLTMRKGFPIGLPLCRPLGQGLYEVRSSLPSKREARLILFHHSGLAALVVLHGFIKKQQRTPKPDLELASRRKRSFAP